MEPLSNPVFGVSIIATCYFIATRSNFADFIKTIKATNIEMVHKLKCQE